MQYLSFLIGLSRGDFGNSLKSRTPAFDLVMERLPATLELTLFAMLVATVVAIPIGIVSAINRGTAVDGGVMMLAMLGQSIPSFWLGLMFILFVGLTLRWLPISGHVPLFKPLFAGEFEVFLTNLPDGIRHLIMPSGYLGGCFDDFIMRLADIQLAFPFILLAIMVLVVLGKGVLNLVLVLGIGQWVTYARIARGETISQREKEYVEAARALGMSRARIILRSILPNILAPLIVIASFNVASVILAEAALSFLGLGVPPIVPTWGGILAESRDQLIGGRWWLAVYPGLALMLTVLSLIILGDWLHDFLDPRLRGAG